VSEVAPAVRRLAPSAAALARAALLAVVIAITALLPLWLHAGWVQEGVYAMSWSIAAIGLTLLVGEAGQLSLGHSFFVAIGAYAYAYLAGNSTVAYGVGSAGGLSWPPLAALVAAVLLAGVAGAVFSPISGRLRGLYLGIATIGLVFLGQHLLNNVDAVSTISGGVNGRSVPPFHVGGLHVTSLRDRWYLCLVLLLPTYWIARNLQRGRPGRAFEAVRDGEIAAGVMGVQVGRTKAAAFTISAMYAGLAGVLVAIGIGSLQAQNFDLTLAINLLAMVVIGGLGSVGGAVLGAVFVTILPFLFDQYASAIPFVVPNAHQGFEAATAARVLYGVAVIASLLFLPRGLATLGSILRPRRRVAVSARRTPAPEPR
jgi:branched-chain amino acid transport system permease protein